MARVPALDKKLKLLYSYTGMNQTALARRLQRSPGTVHGWVHGTATSAPESVPSYGFEGLVQMLADHLPEVIDANCARRLWLGQLDDFARAFDTIPRMRFQDVLALAPQLRMLTYLPEGRRAGYSGNGGELEAGVIPAKVGERFSFRFDGFVSAQVVLLAETAAGTRLIAPGPKSPSQLDAHGQAMLPNLPETYWFDEPRGLRGFLGFAIGAREPLSIAAAAGRETPLSETELNRFAAELSDRARVGSWLWDRVAVDVR